MNSMACADQEVKQQAEKLYRTVWLQQARIKPYTQLPDFGDLHGQPDWNGTNKDACYNIILPTGQNTLLLSEGQFNRMRAGEDSDFQWSAYFVYHHGKNGKPGVAAVSNPDTDLMQIPLLQRAWLNASNRNILSRLLQLINPGEPYASLFKTELLKRSQQHKLVAPLAQRELTERFDPLLDRSAATDTEIRLMPAHLADILRIYEIEEASHQQQAQWLFSLAIVFASLASSAHFGTEDDSPTTLRFYAFALMHEARLLDSDQKVISAQQFNKWRNRLLGSGSVFTCLGTIVEEMYNHARDAFPQVIRLIMPLAWT
ncbi:MAG: hypothetical protein ACRC5A_08400 [Enterobacteriaceae bacterium]